jgi:isochorismate hydrolase
MMIEGKFTEEEVYTLARRACAERSASFSISPDRCALLVIDMQDEFVKPHWNPFWVPEATRQVPNIKRLIEHCRTRAMPVIFLLKTVFQHPLGSV